MLERGGFPSKGLAQHPPFPLPCLTLEQVVVDCLAASPTLLASRQLGFLDLVEVEIEGDVTYTELHDYTGL